LALLMRVVVRAHPRIRGKISGLRSASELDQVSVVLVSTRNPLNIGAVARAMSNFGFSSLRLVNPFEPSFREARSAVGAAELLASAQEYKSIPEAVADCSLVVGTTALRNRELRHPVHRLESASSLIRDHLKSGRVALLFGSEKVGLSNQDLSHCHWLLHIPTLEEHVSMNLGQAAAVCLYELVRSAGPEASASMPLPQEYSSATMADLDRLSALWLETLHASGYLKPGTELAGDEKLRRMLHRLKVPAEDAQVWLGILRQVLWKLKH
jgi:TrmH family RNA methyltransferase